MSSKKIFIPLVIVILAIATIYGIYRYDSISVDELLALEHPPIELEEGDKLYFWKEGFIIKGDKTQYFNSDGSESSFPFKFSEDQTLSNPTITAINEDYVLLNNNILCQLKKNKLQVLKHLEGIFEDMGKLDESLILLETRDGGLNLKGFNLDTLETRDLIPNHEDFFIDYSIDPKTQSLSILTLNLEDSFPISQVYHLDKDFGLFGALSLNDELFLKNFRLYEGVLLIGNQRLLCYNIEGEIEWEFENLGYDDILVSENDFGILIYAKVPFVEPHENKKYSGIYISKDGEKEYVEMPPHLSQVISHGNRFISIEHDKNLLLMNSKGKVFKKYPVDKYLKTLLYNPDEPNFLYLVDEDDRLHVYSTTEEGSH